MNQLSYSSLIAQSLVRYDMANQMLRWAACGMSDNQLSKYNFRQLKKFLQNKGWEYERPYPFKGKGRTTVKLLKIVQEENLAKFEKAHGNLTVVEALYLTAGLDSEGNPAIFNQHGEQLKPNPDDLIPCNPFADSTSVGDSPKISNLSASGCRLVSLARQQTELPTPAFIEKLLAGPRNSN